MATNCLQVPPALKINEALYSDRPMPVHVRLEQRIVWNLLLVLEEAGFEPHSVFDGEEQTTTKTKKAVMEQVFNLDDAWVYFSHRTGETVDGKLRKVWIRLVLGNELDIISDYNASNWHNFETVVHKFDPEVYA